jgi:dihydrofolate reductase
MISLISCMDNNRTIGLNNQLPWHLPEDLKYFKKVTMGHTIVMGRKTFESIGKPLPGRKNIVLTRDPHWKRDGVEVYQSSEELMRNMKNEELFIIGGEEIYKLFINDAKRLYITKLDHSITGDAFFPEISEDWKVISEKTGPKNEANPFNYKFLVMERC